MSKFTERLRDENYAGPMQHLRSYVEIDALFNQAADIIDELERALRDMMKNKSENRNGLTYDMLVPYRYVDAATIALNKLERLK